MTPPNDQDQPGSAVPAWDTTNVTPTVMGAIPMYKVSAPTDASAYPNDQGLIAQNPPQGAIPIRIVAKPTPNANGTYPNDPANDNAAIPVRFVTSAPADTPPYPTDPALDQGAIPAYVVV